MLVGSCKTTRQTTADRKLANYIDAVSLLSYRSYLQLRIVLLGVHGQRKKVKCTLVQALRLSTGRTAHRGSRGIALLFLDHGTRRG